MSTLEKIAAATKKMGAAQAALQEDAERSPDLGADPALQRRLTEELRKAEDGFLETMQ
jgi:hypothetical protein